MRGAPAVAVATGAGISAESGVPTFRGANGLWNGRRIQEIATPQAFQSNPLDVWRFYLERRRNLMEVKPNAGHLAVAAWQRAFEGLTVITQNVDGLHQRAGSRRVLELHGSIWARHCNSCGAAAEDRSLELPDDRVPRCTCGGMLRPSVVWFGESLPERTLAEAFEIANHVKVLVVVGTTNIVYPAASIPLTALAAGAKVIEVNPERTSLSASASLFIEGNAGAVLPGLEERIRSFLE